jgi:hypothetical protein
VRNLPTPFLIIFLRMFGVPLFLAGYVCYQAFIKKKKWPALKNDLMLSSFFVVVYIGLYLVLT